VPHTGWDDQQEAAIRLWLEAWRSFPDLVGRHPLFALLAIELPEPEQGLRRWWPGGDRKRIARQVARLERFVHDECSNVHLLGELSALRRTHALSWIRREVGSYLESHPRKDRRMQIQERLEALLDDRFETRPQCRMKALAPELRSDLDRAIRLDAT
jgi:hypothetical protein